MTRRGDFKNRWHKQLAAETERANSAEARLALVTKERDGAEATCSALRAELEELRKPRALDRMCDRVYSQNAELKAARLQIEALKSLNTEMAKDLAAESRKAQALRKNIDATVAIVRRSEREFYNSRLAELVQHVQRITRSRRRKSHRARSELIFSKFHVDQIARGQHH